MSSPQVAPLEYGKRAGRGVPTHLVWLGLTVLLFYAATVLLFGTTGLHNDNPFWWIWVVVAVVATRAAVRLARPARSPVLAPLTWLALALPWGLGAIYLYHLFTGIDPHVLTRANNNCQTNLRHIGQFIDEYARVHGGHYPDAFGDLMTEFGGYAPAELFVAPFSGDTPAPGPTTREAVDQLATPGHYSYIYLGRGLTTASPAGTIIAYEPLSKHQANIRGIHVLYAGGGTGFFPERKAQKVLAELAAGHNPPKLDP
jgi:hypothetical protein